VHLRCRSCGTSAQKGRRNWDGTRWPSRASPSPRLTSRPTETCWQKSSRLSGAQLLSGFYQRVGILSIAIIVLTHCFCQERQGASADKLQVKADTILPLIRLARSKEGPTNRGQCPPYLYCPPPAGARSYRPAGILWGLHVTGGDSVKTGRDEKVEKLLQCT
jgi:hypothetical protein